VPGGKLVRTLEDFVEANAKAVQREPGR